MTDGKGCHWARSVPLDEKTKRQQFAFEMHDASLKMTASGLGSAAEQAAGLRLMMTRGGKLNSKTEKLDVFGCLSLCEDFSGLGLPLGLLNEFQTRKVSQ